MARDRSDLVRGSTIVGVYRDAASGSRLRSVARDLPSLPAELRRRFGAAGGGSRAVQLSRHARERTERASRNSAFRTAAGRIESWIRGSYCFRWLTAEPEPDVIVIDLRETWTVGPFIDALDRVAGALFVASHRSRTVGVAASIERSVLDRPLRVLGVVVLVAAVASVLANAAFGTPTPAVVAASALVAALGLLGMRSTRSWAEVRETRPVRFLSQVFEPPEPPDDPSRTQCDDRRDSDSSGESEND